MNYWLIWTVFSVVHSYISNKIKVSVLWAVYLLISPAAALLNFDHFKLSAGSNITEFPEYEGKKLFRTKCSTKTSIVWIFSSAISTKLIYQNILIDSYSELPTTFQINGVFSLWNSLLIRHIYWMLHVNFCIVQMSIAIINAFICRLFICCARIVHWTRTYTISQQKVVSFAWALQMHLHTKGVAYRKLTFWYIHRHIEINKVHFARTRHNTHTHTPNVTYLSIIYA